MNGNLLRFNPGQRVSFVSNSTIIGSGFVVNNAINCTFAGDNIVITNAVGCTILGASIMINNGHRNTVRGERFQQVMGCRGECSHGCGVDLLVKFIMSNDPAVRAATHLPIAPMPRQLYAPPPPHVNWVSTLAQDTFPTVRQMMLCNDAYRLHEMATRPILLPTPYDSRCPRDRLPAAHNPPVTIEPPSSPTIQPLFAQDCILNTTVAQQPTGAGNPTLALPRTKGGVSSTHLQVPASRRRPTAAKGQPGKKKIRFAPSTAGEEGEEGSISSGGYNTL